MIAWELLESAQVPGGSASLQLYRRGQEFSIRVDGCELMNSRAHSSEEALAELTCARLSKNPCPTVLIGGMGMGFTTAAALRQLGSEAKVLVAELIPAVLAWNRGPLGSLAGHPLDDLRVSTQAIDVAQLIQTNQQRYDAIILDVDNGPDGLTRTSNNRLYSRAGVKSAYLSLKPSGILAVWSASPAPTFCKLLRQTGFNVEEIMTRSRGSKGGRRHLIWLAKRGNRTVPPVD